MKIDESISWDSIKTTYKRAKEIAFNIIRAFKQEGRETSDMMKVFNYQLRKKLNLDTRRDAPTEQELTDALNQLKEIPKLAPYAIILLAAPIPFSSTMYTALAVYLNRISRGYINLLPSSFNNVFNTIPDKDINDVNIDQYNESMQHILGIHEFIIEGVFNQMSELDRVKDLAIRLHGEQKRKYSGDPYYTHLFRVSDTVRENGGDDAMIMAALLHDVLEDTPTNDTELTFELEKIVDPLMARDIVDLVIELTDVYTKENFPDLNRRARKEMEAKRLGEASPRAQTIKYADLLDNGDDIMRNDPSFGRVYLREKSQILEYMDKGDSILYQKCRDSINY